MQLGLHFVHTISVALPATGLSLPLNVLTPKYLCGETGQLLDHGNFDSTLLISLSTNLPSLYFFLLGWLPVPYHDGLLVQVGGSLYLDLFFSFVMILVLLSNPSSHSLFIQFASGTMVKLSLNTLGPSQSVLHMLHPQHRLT